MYNDSDFIISRVRARVLFFVPRRYTQIYKFVLYVINLGIKIIVKVLMVSVCVLEVTGFEISMLFALFFVNSLSLERALQISASYYLLAEFIIFHLSNNRDFSHSVTVYQKL